jgi:hypothetical protein
MIDVLGEWGARWAFGEPRPNELDPIILLWWMRRRVCFDQISRRRLLIQFEFGGAPRRRYWLLIEPSDASVCLRHPGFDIDVTVTGDIAAFYRVWLGRSSLFEALRTGQVRLEGTPADLRAFPTSPSQAVVGALPRRRCRSRGRGAQHRPAAGLAGSS